MFNNLKAVAILAKQATIASTIIAATLTGLAVTAQSAQASCWNHNGSTLRLVANGNNRSFYYVRPKAVLRRAGVRNGTLLFNGRKNGDWYSGTMRRFSRFCPGVPLEYYVEGPVAVSQLKVTVDGSYKIHRQCKNTGRISFDHLVFTYKSQRC